ncbi:hypothetical protein [Methanocaldococcus fervens]|uniref:Uncharacterized protein n=1 Tax=Methanocaldococcus fervens (strain DSM 4213 / JCM 15782 / AG86) TaxID=573064 RepID=C7P5Y2_METFA|nr:hypothetical protein [Methanocaldococcus fervens]ACV23964.1 hypothetical protein Mefer_0122 [Methanocaldococcus fervens AG86]
MLKEVDDLVNVLIQELNTINEKEYQKLIKFSKNLNTLIDTYIKDELENINEFLLWISIVFNILLLRISKNDNVNYYKDLKKLQKIITDVLSEDKIPIELNVKIKRI